MYKLFPIFLLIVFAPLCLAKSVEEGKPAPSVNAKLLDGTTFALSGKMGKVVIINFWATWCAPCREEMPALETYYQQHRAEGLELIAISIDTPGDIEKVREVMRAYHFSAALIGDANVKEYGRIWRIPMTFIIDRKGILRKNGWSGAPKIDLIDLEKNVTPLLAAP